VSADTPLALRRTALAAFLDAGSEQAAADALQGLLGDDAVRHIRDVVRRELGGFAASHLEDVVADVRLSLMQRLHALRRGRGEAIDNFRAYITRASEHACYSFLRRRYPERSRFRNRVRYAASHHASITFERDTSGTWRCATKKAVRRAPEAGAAVIFMDDPAAFLAARGVDIRVPLPALLDEVLSRLDRAIELDRLVDALALVLGIKDATLAATPTVDESHPLDTIPDPSPGAGVVLEQREQLLQVWNEIASLPVRQRSALLLNLRDPEGGAVLHLLPATGVVTHASIAAALEMSEAELAELWGRLPLEDRAIAESMGLTRQQVINLRKSARARLTRRLQSDEA